MSIRDFKDLIVWKDAVDLAVEVYGVTRSFPAQEKFGLVSQSQKAAVSISSNIAEGNGRGTTRDYIHFLTQARGSLYEVRSLLVVSQRLGYLEVQQCEEIEGHAEMVGRRLSALRTSLSRRL